LQKNAIDLQCSLGSVRNSLDDHTLSFQSLTSVINSVEKTVRHTDDAQIRTNQLLDSLSDSLPVEIGQIHAKLNGLSQNLALPTILPTNFSSNSSFISCSKVALGEVLGFEIERVMTPFLEESFSRSQHLREALLEQVKKQMQDAHTDLLRNISLCEEHCFNETTQAPTLPTNQNESSKTDLAKNIERTFLNIPSQHDNGQILPIYHTQSVKQQKIWSYQSHLPWIGTVRIDISTEHGRPDRANDYFIRVDFWPSQRLPFKRAISMRYSTKTSTQGYYQIAPSIAVYPIISGDAPVWDLIYYNDLHGLISLFVQGLVGPNDQTDMGITLIHVRLTTSKITSS